MHRKLLIYTTLLIFVGTCYTFIYLPPKDSLHTTFVSVGNQEAPVHMILFEEFACVQCQRFHGEDLPYLYQEYIDKGLVKLTTVPLAYLEESTPAFAASCCVAEQGTEHYARFLKYVFSLPDEEREKATARELAYQYAIDHTDLSIKDLLMCVSSDRIFEIRKTHLQFSNSLPREQIEMPTILINGRFVKEIRLDLITQMIQEELYKKGKADVKTT